MPQANKEGLHLTGFRVNNKDEIEKQKNLPIILTLCPEKGVNHSVLVTEIKGGKVHYLDPDTGPSKLKIYDFVNLWDGTGLFIQSDDGVSHVDEFPELPLKDKVLNVLFQCLSGLSCILGIYFLDEKFNIVIPLLFLSAFVISEILLKSCLFKTMQKLDETYLEDLDIPKDRYQDFFLRLEDYKRLSMTEPINFVTSLIVSMFLLVITVLNGISNIVLIAVPFVLSVVDLVFLKPLFEKENKSISKLEKNLDKSESIEDYKANLKTVTRRANKYCKNYISKRYFYIFIMISVSLLVLFLSKKFSLSQVVLYSFIQFFLYEQLSKLFNFAKDNEELDVAKARLNNVIHLNENN